MPFSNSSIDLAYSKGVLTNVKDKSSLFKEVVRLLKRGGSICLIDWLVPESKGQSFETLSMGDFSYKETESSYRDLLHRVGFSDISFEDVSSEYLGYVKALERRLCSSDIRNYIRT